MGGLRRERLRSGALGSLLALTVLLATACQADDGGDEESQAPAETASTESAPVRPTNDPDVAVRWPRYWATVDSAEAGAQMVIGTRLWAGYDDTHVVYNSQDVVRFLERETGKQRTRVLLPRNRFVCGTPASRRIVDAQVVLALGTVSPSGTTTCDMVQAFDSASGERLWSVDVAMDEDVVITQREGRALVTAMDSGNGEILVVDSTSGDVRWRKTLAGITKRELKDQVDEYDTVSSCSGGASLDHEEPVVVTLVSCGFGEQTGLMGLDLETGEVLWSSDLWFETSTFFLPVPHPLDGSVITPSHEVPGALVDVTDGALTPLPRRWAAPKDQDADHETALSACTDVAQLDGLAKDGSCAYYVNGDILLAANGRFHHADDPDYRIFLRALDATTGEELWTRDFHSKDKGDTDYRLNYEAINFNESGSEFWLTDVGGGDVVLRLDSSTGEILARGLAAPPMGLSRFALPAPGMLLNRTQGGVVSQGRAIKSGLNYHRTDAQ